MAKRRVGTKKLRRQRGGDSAAYSFGPAVSAGAPYAAEVVPQEACQAVQRPGFLTNYSAGSGGLPGLSGGARRRLRRGRGRRGTRKNHKGKGRRRGTLKQRGGRYTMDVANTTGGPNPFVPVARAGCEGGSINTLPKELQVQAGGVGGIDSAYYAAPTAGYTNTPSTWTSSTGTPSMLQIPEAARTMNPACLKTGGRRKV
jgi:hypothetical protein